MTRACSCRAAAINVYQALKSRGDDESHAYEAAVRVFQHYHPECKKVEAYEAVANWLDERESDWAKHC